MKYQKINLKNGLRVILVPMPEAQTVTAEILVAVGSKYETKKINGVSLFLEHMVFKGTKKRPNARAIAEEVESVGGVSNAFTGKEQTGYWVKMPTIHWKTALDIVGDIFLHPTIPVKEIEKERGVILQEESMYKDLPSHFVWNVFEELLYGNQPAGWSIAGSIKSINSISRKDIVDYYKKYYSLGSAVLVLAGNFNEKEAIKEIEKIFGKKKNVLKKNVKKNVIEKQDIPQLKIHYKETDQTHVLIGFRSCDMFSPERFSALVAGTILGGNMSSRLFNLLREKYGLTYYVDADSEQMTDTGYFYARAGVKHSNLGKVIKLIISEMRNMKTKKVTPKELKNAKEYLKGTMSMSLENSSSVASFLGNQELFKEEIKSPEDFFLEIDKVTSEDIFKIAQKYFVNKNLNLAVVGPHKENDVVKFLKI